MNAFKRTAQGIRAWIGLFGDGGRPVEATTAMRRARICAHCTLNEKACNGLLDAAAQLGGEVVRELLKIKLDQNLTLDEATEKSLGQCKACGCWLRLKVWQSLAKVQSETTDEALVKIKADAPGCWVIAETAK